MMEKMMLEDGVESQGAAHREYDKYGKRHMVCEPMPVASHSPSTATHSVSASDGVSSPVGADGATKRTKTF